MEREKYIMNNNYNDIISELIKSSIDKTDFCNKVISLDANDNFDEYISNNKDVSEIFELCIRFLDHETTDKEEIWSQIESIIK